jgi:hypothetical protein
MAFSTSCCGSMDVDWNERFNVFMQLSAWVAVVGASATVLFGSVAAFHRLQKANRG